VTPIRVVLADDQELIRAGLRLVLRRLPDIAIVGEADDGVAAIELLRSVTADVVVMDVRMPRMGGVEATRRIRAAAGESPRGEGPRVLILTTFDLDEYAFEALRAGASGFLLKDVGPERLADAIRTVHAGNAVVAPTTTRRLLDRFARHLPVPADGPAPHTDLTAREREILTEVAKGLSNAEIAARLFLSEGTVRTHVSHILLKLGLRGRVQAVVYAYEHGLA
jgi:DNA-binding NarL/FixJ family response regulator